MKIVKISAKWCPPCKVYAPTFKRFAEENPNVFTVEVDVDEDKWRVAQMFGVKQIPTTVFIKDDGTYEKEPGVLTIESLNNRLNGEKTNRTSESTE